MVKKEFDVWGIVQADTALATMEGKAVLDMSWAIDDLRIVFKKHVTRYREEEAKLLKQFGTETSKGFYNVKMDRLPAYQEALENLKITKVTIEYEPLSYDRFLKDGLKVDNQYAASLRDFIVKPEKKKEPEKAIKD